MGIKRTRAMIREEFHSDIGVGGVVCVRVGGGAGWLLGLASKKIKKKIKKVLKKGGSIWLF